MDSKYIPPPKISDEHVATVQRSTNYVTVLFEAIRKRHGEDTARKMFALYGRALSKTDNRIRRDAALLWRLASMEKPNISRLAREIEGECGKEESIEKYLKRIGRTEKSASSAIPAFVNTLNIGQSSGRATRRTTASQTLSFGLDSTTRPSGI